MTPTALLLVSPREPSGGSWLINCLLELGVRVNFKPTIDRVWRSVSNPREPSAMWRQAPDGRWRLQPRAEALKKWLPILTVHETLSFIDDVEALYVQDLPTSAFQGQHTALFVRDPRDAIYSSYRRIQPEMTLDEFVRFPHPETLLDVVGHWQLFVESWLARDGVHVYRFEDYKAEAEGLLTRVVRDLHLQASPEDIARAAAASTFEKARAAEAHYRARHPGDSEIAIRAGQVGEWRTSQELRDLSREVERRVGSLLKRLGYELHANAGNTPVTHGLSQLRFLSIFDRIGLPEHLRGREADPTTCSALADILKFASTVDADRIRRVRLHAREARLLFDSLEEYVDAWNNHRRQRAAKNREQFADGADYHMTRIAELMASRRPRN
jgi:hypothetical protein